jgi:MFS family permease
MATAAAIDPPGRSDGDYPSIPRGVLAFAFLMVAEFFYAWAWYSVDILRPFIRDSLGMSLTQAGSGYSAQAAGALIGAVVVGQMADRIGRRAMLMTVMIGYGVTLVAGVFVESYTHYLAQRALLGLFMGGIFPVVVGIYVGLFRNNVSGRLASLINGTASLAIVVQGLAIGAIAGHDWRLLLWLGGVPPVLLAVLAFVVVPRSADTRTARTPGAALPLLELFAAPVRRQTILLAVLMGLNFFGYQAFSGWLTTYLRDERALTPATVGELVAVVSTANIIGGFVWGWLGDRFGRRFNALGFFAAAVAVVLYLIVPSGFAVLAVLGASYGFMLSTSVIWGPWLTELYPPHLKSTAASIFNWGRIVSIFAPLITGQLASGVGLPATMALASVAFVIAGGIWLSLPETNARGLLPGGGRKKD